MTLGAAILIAMILYLIDRNRVWKQAAKVVVGLVILAVIGGAGFYGWVKYQAWKEAKAQAIADAETAMQNEAYEQSIKKCASEKTAEWTKEQPNGDIFDKVYAEQAADKVCRFNDYTMYNNMRASGPRWQVVAPPKPHKRFGNATVVADTASVSRGGNFMTAVHHPARVLVLGDSATGYQSYDVQLADGRKGQIAKGDVQVDKEVATVK